MRPPVKSSGLDTTGWIGEKLGKILNDGEVSIVSSESIMVSEGQVVALPRGRSW